jgi:hypothetical protein
MRNRAIALIVVAAAALSFTACGSDDGNDVRSNACGGSGSDAASGSGSGSGAGGSGAASGSACAEDASEPKCEPVGNKDEAETTVKVTLDEWTVKLDKASAHAGMIHFALDNVGDEAHEMVVAMADDAAALPLTKDGGLDEQKLPKGSVIGEVEGFPPGKTCDGTFDLAAGTYQLLCNIVETEDNKVEAHLHEGMHTTFTVT